MINEPETLVVEGLRGLLRSNPELALIEHERGMSFQVDWLIVVVLRGAIPEKVTLISGGGSGHEPVLPSLLFP